LLALENEFRRQPPWVLLTTAAIIFILENADEICRARLLARRVDLSEFQAKREIIHLAVVGERSAIGRLWDISFKPGEWLLSKFSRLDKSHWPILWVIGLFLVQAIPATIIRASNLEEGGILAMARGAVEDGHWLTPFIYGGRFAERPVLSSWIASFLGAAPCGACWRGADTFRDLAPRL
jgi:hypothetical protein